MEELLSAIFETLIFDPYVLSDETCMRLYAQMREEEAAFARSLSEEQRDRFNLLFEMENQFFSHCGGLSFLVGLNTRLWTGMTETAKRRPHPNAPPVSL